MCLLIAASVEPFGRFKSHCSCLSKKDHLKELNGFVQTEKQRLMGRGRGKAHRGQRDAGLEECSESGGGKPLEMGVQPFL